MVPMTTTAPERSNPAPNTLETEPVAPTSAKAAQLIKASTRITLDPFEEVDWERPIDDSAFHTPPELLALFGTETWSRMSKSERITYSRHETAAIYAAGIWFENMLMQIVLKHLTTIDVTDPTHRYLLVEVADECRHSMMFGEYIRNARTPSYQATLPFELDGTPAVRTLSYVLILAVEELLDFINRAAMRDERVHLTVREISKLHVMEEARHVAFAKTYLTETWPALSPDDQAIVRDMAPGIVAEVIALNLNAAVFEHLEIEDGHEIARNNPAYRDTIVRGLDKLTAFLDEIGVIADDDTRWAELGLQAATPQ